MTTATMATDKLRVTALINPTLKPDLERLAELENRSVSNFIESLVIQAIEKARTEGRLTDNKQGIK